METRWDGNGVEKNETKNGKDKEGEFIMDPAYIDLQKALDECRDELAKKIWEGARNQQEFQCLHQINVETNGEVDEAWKAEALFWRNECLCMKKSLSWKITKPLRLVQMAWGSFCDFGAHKTLERIGKYIRRTS